MKNSVKKVENKVNDVTILTPINMTKNITLSLIQESTDSSLEFTKTIESDYIDEISGTISSQVKKLYDLKNKFKVNLGGFSFSRKFQVVVSINDVKASFGTLSNSQIKFFMTITKSKTDVTRYEKNMINFVMFIDELTKFIMTNETDLITTKAELIEDIKKTYSLN